MRAIHPLRDHQGLRIGIDKADAVRLSQDRRRWRAHLADGIENIREFARQDGGRRLVDISHLTDEPTAVSEDSFTYVRLRCDVSQTRPSGSLPTWMKCWNAN